MANPNPNTSGLRPVTSETAAELGAIGGRNKKGSKHINTWIQDLLEDESFEANILDPKVGYKEYKGAPIKAIVQVATIKAVNGDAKMMDWLAKYGWSQKQEIEHTGVVNTGISDPKLAAEFTEFLKQRTKE